MEDIIKYYGSVNNAKLLYAASYDKKGSVVKNIKTLEGMAKEGLIKLNNQTGAKLNGFYGGKPSKCYYIDDKCDTTQGVFKYKNNYYYTRYFSGCFCPYVIQLPTLTVLKQLPEYFYMN
jgi:hypothetical protein